MPEPLVGPLVDAGTAIPVRDGAAGLEVLLVHKGSGPQFHAGSWVFPGGKVDPEDRAGVPDGDRLAACAVAAVRETAEEAGVALDPASLVPFAHWTTPEGAPRRFATWFFLATPVVGGDHAPSFDGSEIQNAAWLTPQQALDQHHDGELDLPVPQYVSLLALADAPDVAAACAAAQANEPIEYLGRLREDDRGRLVFVYLPDAAFDGGPLDTPGARHRLVIDGRHMRYARP
jgi:8-oxo-dGTP pyrophosphatase MutT (NUDIX family)